MAREEVERWAVVPHTPAYSVSSWGRVKSLRRAEGNNILTPAKNTQGYLHVTFSVKGERRTRPVHLLVAVAFLGPRPDGMQVAHYDGDRLNNRLENLRYCSCQENHQDKRRHGTMPMGATHPSALRPELTLKGEKHGGAKLTEQDVLAIRAAKVTQTALAVQYGVSQTTVSDIRRRNVWRHI